MKKIFLAFIVLLIFINIISPNEAKNNENKIDVLGEFSSKSKSENRIWVGTFQLVWNDFMDYIIKGPIEFVGYESKLANSLNKQTFNTSYLSNNSYYKTYGLINLALKKKIEKDILKKFNEKSDILNSIDWSEGKNKYLVYAMLKKDFKFINAFNKLELESFGNNNKKIEYFGIDKKTKHNVRNNINVLFFNNQNDFALKLKTKSNDEVYLYRTNNNESFDKIYNQMLEKSKNYKGNKTFGSDDLFKVPNINLYCMKSFDELTNRTIKNTDGLVISDAIETIDFKMDNKGVALKSEAAIVAKMTALVPENNNPRVFYFDDVFYLFLMEKNKDLPYFALRVFDVENINKTRKNR